MASILDMLRKKDPNMNYNQVQNAMGMPSQESMTDSNDELTLPPSPEDVPQQGIYDSYNPSNEKNDDNEDNQDEEDDNVNADEEVASIPSSKPPTPSKKPIEMKFPEKELVANKKQDNSKKDPEDLQLEDAMNSPPQSPASMENGLSLQDNNDNSDLSDLQNPKHGTTEATRANLVKAQNRDQNLRDIGLWGNIGAHLGGAIGKADSNTIKSNVDLANAVGGSGHNQEQLAQRIALEKQDPNSDYSSATRDFAKQSLGMNLPDTVSSEQVTGALLKMGISKAQMDAGIQKKMLDFQQKKAALEESTRHHGAQEEGYNERTKQLANMPFFNQGARDDRTLSGQIQQSNSKLNDPNNRYNQQINRANNLFATVGLDPNMNPDKLDDKEITKKLNSGNRLQVSESAMEVAGLLSGGKPPVSVVMKMLPDNFKNRETAVQDFVNGDLNPADQAAVLKVFLKIGHRVREQNNKYLDQQKHQLLDPLKPMIDQSKNKGLQQRYQQTVGPIASPMQPQGVKMLSPDGNIHMVRPEEVENAKAAGGTLVPEGQ